MHGDKTRAEPVQAGKVLVARRLVDLALAAEFRLDRLDGDAVGLQTAIAASFANLLIDHDTLVRIGKQAAFATAAFFRRTGLIIDQHSQSRNLAQIFLNGIQFRSVMKRRSRGPGVSGIVFVRLVGNQHDTLRALGRNLAGDFVNRETALMRLTAGHGDGVVVEDLVGHVGAGRLCGADRQISGMVIGAVAKILEHMIAFGKMRFPNPVGAFAAHLGVALR